MKQIIGNYQIYAEEQQDADDRAKEDAHPERRAWVQVDWPQLTAKECRDLAEQLIAAAQYLEQSAL